MKEHIKTNWAFFLALLVALLATWLAVGNTNQPLLEQHSFRQTQTALTSYWMIQDGLKLAYETPVVGYPWSIPFEFPVYQVIVASLVKIFDFPLDATGRLVSFAFLLACAWPSLAIVKRLKLASQVAWIFCTLLWSSPLYLFWGRTFMIETTAVFFALVTVQYALDMLETSPKLNSVLLLTSFATLGMLQKATTVGPVLMVMGLVTLTSHLKSKGFTFPSFKKVIYVAMAFAIPLGITLIWTAFTDDIKMQNPYGTTITSSALSEWNYGTLKQRFDINIWMLILVKRIAQYNIGPLGVLIFVYAFFMGKNNLRFIILICLILFVLPVMIFTNLHLVHNYYQTASALFLIAGLTLSVALAVPKKVKGVSILPILVFLLVSSNLFGFHLIYQESVERKYSIENNRTLAASDVIRRYTDSESGIVVFGNDWSSEIPYYSQRKAFVVPSSYVDYDSVWRTPETFIGDLKLGAIVFILDGDKINLTSILARSENGKTGGLFEIFEKCYMWLPGIHTISNPARPNLTSQNSINNDTEGH